MADTDAADAAAKKKRKRRRSVRMDGHAAKQRLDRPAKKSGGRLTYQERKDLPSDDFVFPKERKYPIENESHARNALARVAQHGSPAQKRRVRDAVHRKYPGIDQGDD